MRAAFCRCEPQGLVCGREEKPDSRESSVGGTSIRLALQARARPFGSSGKPPHFQRHVGHLSGFCSPGLDAGSGVRVVQLYVRYFQQQVSAGKGTKQRTGCLRFRQVSMFSDLCRYSCRRADLYRMVSVNSKCACVFVCMFLGYSRWPTGSSLSISSSVHRAGSDRSSSACSCQSLERTASQGLKPSNRALVLFAAQNQRLRLASRL